VSRGGCSTAVAVFPPTLFFLIVMSLLPASAKKIGIVHDLQGILGLSGGGWSSATPVGRLADYSVGFGGHPLYDIFYR